MNFLELRKWKELLFVCIGVLSFCACSEDEKEWELIESEVTFGSNNLDAFGEKKVIKIKTNSYWEITANNTNKYGNDESNWITFDKTSGVGDAEIIATIPEYKLGYEREKKICILTGHYTKEGSKKTVNNVAGGDSHTWTVSQSSIDNLVRNSLKVTFSNMKAYYSYSYSDRFYSYEGSFDYKIEYNTTDERVISIIKSMISSVNVRYKYGTNYGEYENETISFKIGESSYTLPEKRYYSYYYVLGIEIVIALNDGKEITFKNSIDILRKR